MFFLNAYIIFLRYMSFKSEKNFTLQQTPWTKPNRNFVLRTRRKEKKKKRESFILLNNIKHFGIINYKLYIIDIYYRYIPKSQNIKIEKKRVYKY